MNFFLKISRLDFMALNLEGDFIFMSKNRNNIDQNEWIFKIQPILLFCLNFFKNYFFLFPPIIYLR